MRILFKYPTFRRPSWFKSTLQKYYDMLSEKHEYEFLITLNEDDETMTNSRMRSFMESFSHLGYKIGNHKTKIEAINADMDSKDFDILFLVSDDMIPIVPGFDDVIVQAMEENFPDLDGALHYNDDCCGKDRTITLSIMGKKLYDWFGYIYHFDYNSFFCDNEFTDEVRRMEKVVYFPEVIVKHDFRGWSGADETYKRNTKSGRPDESTYKKRKAAGFPKGSVLNV